jgi:ribose 5-phosphate isomerase A
LEEVIMNEKQLAGEKAAAYVQDGMTIGLGTGSTVFHTIQQIGRMVKEGLQIRAVSTSSSTTRLAESLQIPLVSLEDVERIDLTIDGADEVDPAFRGIKGGGGALLFEKIVAVASDRNIWVVDSGKCTPQLGRFPLPVEVVPFACGPVRKLLEKEGCHPVLRVREGHTYRTDSGHVILDLHLQAIEQAEELARFLKLIPGVVEHGLFLNIADVVIVGRGDAVDLLEK